MDQGCITVPWLRIDDGFTQHPKITRLTKADRWTWLEILCYVARYRTSGIVPASVGEVIRGATPVFLNRCFELHLLDLSVDGTEDYLIHDWDDYNGRDPKVLQAERQRKRRDIGVTDAVTSPLQERDESRDESVTHAQARARVPQPLPQRSNTTPPPGAQSLVAEYVDQCRALGVEPAARAKGQVARHIGELLGEGQPVETIRGAIGLLVERRLHPATLPTLLLEAAAGPRSSAKGVSARDIFGMAGRELGAGA